MQPKSRFKQGLVTSVLLFFLAIPILVQMVRLGKEYESAFIVGIGAGLASGHLFMCAVSALSAAPVRWRAAGIVIAVAMFIGPLPFLILPRWPHASAGFGLSVFAIVALESSVLAISRPNVR